MNVNAIKKAIESLPKEDFGQLRRWFADKDWHKKTLRFNIMDENIAERQIFSIPTPKIELSPLVRPDLLIPGKHSGTHRQKCQGHQG